MNVEREGETEKERESSMEFQIFIFDIVNIRYAGVKLD